jgi:hypothetical protein
MREVPHDFKLREFRKGQACAQSAGRQHRIDGTSGHIAFGQLDAAPARPADLKEEGFWF